MYYASAAKEYMHAKREAEAVEKYLDGFPGDVDQSDVDYYYSCMNHMVEALNILDEGRPH